MLVTEINPNDELWLSEVEAPQILLIQTYLHGMMRLILLLQVWGVLELLLLMKPSIKI